MISLETNTAAITVARPLLDNLASISDFVATGEIPDNAEFLPTPKNMGVSKNTFWVQPLIKAYQGINSYLINPSHEVSCLVSAHGSTKVECHAIGDVLFVGLRDIQSDGPVLKPLVSGLHPIHKLDQATFIGYVEAAL
ncbi:hypothetical protein LCGC14_0282100 [marine sediment metagenome]|uniref:Uncharacterized protein n=1 Tax=marine sediment metagenome TaxID=412755 RepID=A0A0F9WGM3_9ZZZZ